MNLETRGEIEREEKLELEFEVDKTGKSEDETEDVEEVEGKEESAESK